MHRNPQPTLLEAVQAALSSLPDGAGVETLMDRLDVSVSRRTLQRRLAEWSSVVTIRAEGIGKARRYLAPASGAIVTPDPAALGLSPSAPTIDAVPVSKEGAS